MDQERWLVVHAGTHKTATTYIQNRLWSNRDKLLKKSIFLLAPETRKFGRNYQFATNIANRKNRRIRKSLESVPADVSHVIVSDERLTSVLIEPDLLDGLLKAVKRAGYRLRLVFFLRDQPDYINSLYVQEIKRFYHMEGIGRYVKRCLRRRRKRFDYKLMFAGLLDHPEVDVQFLPFGSGYGDPFIRLMDAQGWNDEQGWNDAVAMTINDQVGTKGVWLARKVARRLQEMGVDPKALRGQSRFVSLYSQQRKWTRDRYYGIDQDLIKKIREHYLENNNAFAQAVWKCSWEDCFPWPERELNIFDLGEVKNKKLRLTLRSLVEQVVCDIKSEKPEIFPESCT